MALITTLIGICPGVYIEECTWHKRKKLFKNRAELEKWRKDASRILTAYFKKPITVIFVELREFEEC